MADLKTIVNKNDNNAERDPYYKGNDHIGPDSRLLDYVPLARQLIQRYCSQPWKHTINCYEYGFLEYQLTTLLEPICTSAKRHVVVGCIGNLSICLQCSQTRLLNDPDLNKFIKPSS